MKRTDIRSTDYDCSASEIAQLIECPRAWYEHRVNGRRRPPTEAMAAGSAVHAVIEAAINRSIQSCAARFMPPAEISLEELAAASVATGIAMDGIMLAQVFRALSGRVFVAAEQAHVVTIAGVRVLAVLDAIQEEAWIRTIVDWKSGEYFPSRAEWLESPQALIYLAVAHKLGMSGVSMVHLRSGQHHDAKPCAEWLRDAGNLVAEHMATAKTIREAGGVAGTPGTHCAVCVVIDDCAEYQAAQRLAEKTGPDSEINLAIESSNVEVLISLAIRLKAVNYASRRHIDRINGKLIEICAGDTGATLRGAGYEVVVHDDSILDIADGMTPLQIIWQALSAGISVAELADHVEITRLRELSELLPDSFKLMRLKPWVEYSKAPVAESKPEPILAEESPAVAFPPLGAWEKPTATPPEMEDWSRIQGDPAMYAMPTMQDIRRREDEARADRLATAGPQPPQAVNPPVPVPKPRQRRKYRLSEKQAEALSYFRGDPTGAKPHGKTIASLVRDGLLQLDPNDPDGYGLTTEGYAAETEAAELREAYEERAAIQEYDGGLARVEAEKQAEEATYEDNA